jgi:hypothetical protein
MLCDSEAIRLWPWPCEPPSAGVALNGVRHRGSHGLIAGFFSKIGAEAGVASVVADVASVLPELLEVGRSLLSEVELRGLKYWWALVLSGGVLSALRCVREALRCTSRTKVCVSGSGITRGASRFGEGRRGGCEFFGRLLTSICFGGAYIALLCVKLYSCGGTTSCLGPSSGALIDRSRSGGRPGIVALHS